MDFLLKQYDTNYNLFRIDHKDHNGVKGPLCNVVIQCIALELRQNDIRGTACKSKEHHDKDQCSHRLQERKDPADPEEFKMFCLLFFHDTVTSREPLWVS